MAYHAAPYKAWLLAAARALKQYEPHAQLAGPLAVDIDVRIKRPQKTARAYPPFDLDNYAKGPLDALTKAGVWKDDEQVVQLHVTKRYCDVEGIDVTITPLALTII